MEGGHVLLACNHDLPAPIASSITQRAYAAPGVGWFVRRYGYDSWRDPHRKGS